MTFTIEALFIVSALCLSIGVLIGAIISRTFMSPSVQNDLEARLRQAKGELDQYQQDVAQHFADTSKLVANMTQSYKDVHDHLAKGAMSLTNNTEISRKIIEAGEQVKGGDNKEAIENVNFEPPRDWAPKTPGQKGTLSEDFGFEEMAETAKIEELTATGRQKA